MLPCTATLTPSSYRTSLLSTSLSRCQEPQTLTCRRLTLPTFTSRWSAHRQWRWRRRFTLPPLTYLLPRVPRAVTLQGRVLNHPRPPTHPLPGDDLSPFALREPTYALFLLFFFLFFYFFILLYFVLVTSD